MEELQLWLEAEICGLQMEALTDLAKQLKVNTEGLRKLILSKKIREKMEQNVEESEDKKGLLLSFATLIAGNPPPLEDDDKQIHVKDELAGQDEKPKEQTKETMSKVKVDVSKILKRDFKIHGVIGGENYKDGLSFVSLARQIDTGITTGYKESEVIEAVIRAVSPSLKLRSYLEMIQDLTLVRLKQIMKAHFKQKSGTELYQELSVIHQETNESSQDFLIRAMNLKQQVIFVSRASDSAIKYEPPLVQALFLHVVETGLQEESVRTKLRPLLEKPAVTDEELMEKINQIMSVEMERQNKMGAAGKKGPRVSQVRTTPSTDDLAPGHPSQEPQKKNAKSQEKGAKPNSLVAALEAVQSDLASLKETLHRPPPQTLGETFREYPRTSRPRDQRRQCSWCQTSGANRCDHCFKCGSADHFARGCRKGYGSGNGKRLQPRDRL